jgi:1,4-dihydroxy-2-naphthoyl-CoA synthase
MYAMLLSSKATTATTAAVAAATTASRISCRRPSRVLRCFSSDDRRVETKVDALGVCYVTLNRPDKLNAVDLTMFEAVAEAASNIQKDRNIRAVILSGTGRAFCTGLDVVRKARYCYIILYHIRIMYSCRMETEV